LNSNKKTILVINAREATNLPVVLIDDVFCIKFNQDLRFYKLHDVALWTKTKLIKTAEFKRVSAPAFGETKLTFEKGNEFIVSYQKAIALYSVNIWRNSDNHEKIGDVYINKISYSKGVLIDVN